MSRYLGCLFSISWVSTGISLVTVYRDGRVAMVMRWQRRR